MLLADSEPGVEVDMGVGASERGEVSVSVRGSSADECWSSSMEKEGYKFRRSGGKGIASPLGPLTPSQ